MTLLRSKIFLIVSAFLLLGSSRCSHSNYKVYNMDPELGLERAQDEELIPFSDIPRCQVDGEGAKECKYGAMTWEDIRTLAEELARCRK